VVSVTVAVCATGPGSAAGAGAGSAAGAGASKAAGGTKGALAAVTVGAGRAGGGVGRAPPLLRDEATGPRDDSPHGTPSEVQACMPPQSARMSAETTATVRRRTITVRR